MTAKCASISAALTMCIGKPVFGGQRRVEGLQHAVGMVIDQDIDRAQLGFAPVEQQRDIGGVAQIGLARHGDPALSANLGQQRLDTRLLHRSVERLAADARLARLPHLLLRITRRLAIIGDGDACALAGERPRRRRADAVVGAGDQHDLSRQSRVDHLLPAAIGSAIRRSTSATAATASISIRKP